MQETWVWSLDREDPMEKEMVTHSSTLAWRIPWIEDPGGLQFAGLLYYFLIWLYLRTTVKSGTLGIKYIIFFSSAHTRIKGSLNSAKEGVGSAFKEKRLQWKDSSRVTVKHCWILGTCLYLGKGNTDRCLESDSHFNSIILCNSLFWPLGNKLGFPVGGSGKKKKKKTN